MTPRIKQLTGAFLAAFLLMSLRCAAAEPLQIYAAGSLTAAFTDIVKAFPTAEGSVAAPMFGPSGVLREKIEHGDRVDILASAAWNSRGPWHAPGPEHSSWCSPATGYAWWDARVPA